jgi:hypothetical protein
VAELKTQKTKASVAKFLAAIADEERRRDCEALAAMMKKATKAEGKMWGPSIVGFGDYHYLYARGRENDWFEVGFAPRKGDISVYLMGGIDRHAALLAELGTFKRAKGCLYLRRLADVDRAVLGKMIAAAVAHLRKS